eukprot:1143819-Pelagomonas_calceolata.AAC.2
MQRDPTHSPERMIPRDFHLIELNFCSENKPEQTLITPKINTKTLLRTSAQKSLEVHRNKRVTLHTVLIGGDWGGGYWTGCLQEGKTQAWKDG